MARVDPPRVVHHARHSRRPGGSRSGKRGELTRDGVAVEKWIFTAEPGSKIPALVYRPEKPPLDRLPAVVLTYGHGSSKSAWQYHYAGQLYARLGLICLAIDPIGEELHQRGATLVSPDPPIRPLTRKQLAVLKPEEVGKPEFTLDGWLGAIESVP